MSYDMYYDFCFEVKMNVEDMFNFDGNIPLKYKNLKQNGIDTSTSKILLYLYRLYLFGKISYEDVEIEIGKVLSNRNVCCSKFYVRLSSIGIPTGLFAMYLYGLSDEPGFMCPACMKEKHPDKFMPSEEDVKKVFRTRRARFPKLKLVKKG